MKDLAKKIQLAAHLQRQEQNLTTAIDSLKSITHSFFISQEFQGDDEIRMEIAKMVARLETLKSETTVNHLLNKIVEFKY